MKCSGTLTAVWAQATSNRHVLSDSVYEIAREILLKRFGNSQTSGEFDTSEISLTTYNAPPFPPFTKHNFPDTISQSVTVSPDALTLVSTTPVVQLKTVSFLRNSIAELRDTINSLSKAKSGWNFRLLEIHEERAIADVFLSCDTKEELTYRLGALRSLIAWMNVAQIEKIVNDGVKRQGSINWLEVFLKRYYTDDEVESVINKLRCINDFATGYPIHVDNERVLKAYDSLKIIRPIEDFKEAWEKVLNLYKESLAELLRLLRK